MYSTNIPYYLITLRTYTLLGWFCTAISCIHLVHDDCSLDPIFQTEHNSTINIVNINHQHAITDIFWIYDKIKVFRTKHDRTKWASKFLRCFECFLHFATRIFTILSLLTTEDAVGDLNEVAMIFCLKKWINHYVKCIACSGLYYSLFSFINNTLHF